MARHVIKKHFNRFANRYSVDNGIEYTEQDKQRLHLIKPDTEACQPVVHHRASFARKSTTIDTSLFEQQFQAFVNQLRNKKPETKVEVPANNTDSIAADFTEEHVTEVTPVIEETIAEDVVETPVVETKPVKKKKSKRVEVQTEAPAYPDDGKSEGETSELPMFDLF